MGRRGSLLPLSLPRDQLRDQCCLRRNAAPLPSITSSPRRSRFPRRDHIDADPSIFRAAESTLLLSRFGRVFRRSISSPDALAPGASSPSTLHRDADAVYLSTRIVDQVDVFISHSWHSNWRLKGLALLYDLNIGLAVTAAAVTWAMTILSLLAVNKWDPSTVYRMPYAGVVLMLVPTVVLFVFFFWGHRLSCGFFLPKSVWMDKLCIHQTRPDLRQKGTHTHTPKI